MCEPVTLGIATGLAVAGAGASAYSSYRQGQYMRALGVEQQKTAEVAATYTEQAGAAQGSRIQSRATQVIGAQRAAAGASGIDAGSGAAVAREGDTAAKAQLDVETAKNNAAMQAWGIRTEGAYRSAQSNAQASAYDWNAAGDLMAAGGSALGGYSKVKRAWG